MPGRGQPGALPRGRGRRPGGDPAARRRRHLDVPAGAVGYLPRAIDALRAEGFEFGVVELAEQASPVNQGSPIRWFGGRDRPRGSGEPRSGRSCLKVACRHGLGRKSCGSEHSRDRDPRDGGVVLLACGQASPPPRGPDLRRAGGLARRVRGTGGERGPARGPAPSRPRTSRPTATSAQLASRTGCSPSPTSPRTTARRRSYLDAARGAADFLVAAQEGEPGRWPDYRDPDEAADVAYTSFDDGAAESLTCCG